MSPQGRNRAPRGLVLSVVRFVWDNRPGRSPRHSRSNTRDTVPPPPAIQAGGTHRSRAVSTSGPRLAGCHFCSAREDGADPQPRISEGGWSCRDPDQAPLAPPASGVVCQRGQSVTKGCPRHLSHTHTSRSVRSGGSSGAPAA